MKKLFPVKIRLKLFLMILSSLLITTILFMIISSFFIERVMINQFTEHLERYYDRISSDFKPEENYVKFLKKHEKGLRGFITIIDGDGNILETTAQQLANVPKLPNELWNYSETVRNSDTLPFNIVLAKHPDFGFPILLGFGRLSSDQYVILDKPLEIIEENVQTSMKAMMITVPIALLFGIVLSYLFAYIFIRPILAIKSKALAISQQDFAEDLMLDGDDELVDLGNTMNSISHSLNSSLNELKESCVKLQLMSETDPLTGLSNRLKIDKVLDEEVYKADNRDKKFSMILADIDFFKNVNDTYGHQVGDEVLKCFSSIITEHSRKSDIVGRWGGEEFIVILPDTDQEGAFITAEKLRSSIEEFDFPNVGRKTASFGVNEYVKGNDLVETFNDLDDALYLAKESGRNKVVVSKVAELES